MNRIWKAGRFELTYTPGKPLLMGILNLTPDSFSDGGRYNRIDLALQHARQLLDEGATILDVGGESTRPGSTGVSAEEEWSRISGVLTELLRWGVPVSVDTLKTAVMQQVVELGVDILNDVNGFRDQGAEQLLAASEVGAVVMHMQGAPRTMQQSPVYADVVQEVEDFLRQRSETLQALGVSSQRLLVDPGFGFGKSLQHNIDLLKATHRMAGLCSGVLVGVSRKRMIGELTGQDDPACRVFGSVAAALQAAARGAAVLRVHDVRATADALKVWSALN